MVKHREVSKYYKTDSRKDKTISIGSLIKLAGCVLKNSIFQHGKPVLKQLRGTAIGIKMVPPYAIIFMDSLEQDILINRLLKTLVWWHYIDDIFMLCEHEEEELQEFLETINCCHPTIKLTAEYPRVQINFLDITVMKKGNQLATELYVKPTDTHPYLHASSCHVSHCKKLIPFSQALRFNRICSENVFFNVMM